MKEKYKYVIINGIKTKIRLPHKKKAKASKEEK
jgi:hypothetical protein